MPPLDAQLRAQLEALHASSFGWALACCRRDHDLAAETLQQAYVKVLSGRARFDGRSSLRTWFFGVVRLTARELQRWRWLPWASPLEESPPRPDAIAEANQEAAALERALATLAPRQREVLHLVFYEGLSIAEAAAVLGISVGSARQHHERGKHNLRAKLDAQRGGDERR